MAQHVQFVAVLALVYVTACAASTGRALLASQTVPGCQWAGGECSFNPQIALSLTASDAKARLAQKVAAMIYTCSSATNTTCAAQSYCHWSSYTTTCSFSPSWEELLACPGSKVAQGMVCAQSEAEAACNKVSGCAWLKPTATQLLQMQVSKSDTNTTAALTASTSSDTNTTTSDSTGISVGVCAPTGYTVDSYIEAMISSIKAATTGVFDAASWGTCDGVSLLAEFQTCYNETEAACNSTAVCTWSGIGNTCSMAPGGDLTLLFSSSNKDGDFDKKINATITACAAATNETLCTAAGTASQVTFDDAVVTTALQYSQPAASTAGAVAAAVHLVMAAAAAVVLLMA